MRSIAGSVLAILVCGSVGALGGWVVAQALGLTGVPGALLAVAIAMPLAASAWIAGSVLLRRLGLLR